MLGLRAGRAVPIKATKPGTETRRQQCVAGDTFRGLAVADLTQAAVARASRCDIERRRRRSPVRRGTAGRYPQAERRAAPARGLPRFGMLKILAVDDLHDHAETLVLLCEALGHVARVAFDGGEAVEIAGQFDPDVVFLDLDMPVLDGIKAARAIREIRCARRRVLVALTGRTEFRFRHSAEVAGFDAYMTKPVDIDSLVEFIDRTDRDRRLQITAAMPSL